MVVINLRLYGCFHSPPIHWWCKSNRVKTGKWLSTDTAVSSALSFHPHFCPSRSRPLSPLPHLGALTQGGGGRGDQGGGSYILKYLREGRFQKNQSIKFRPLSTCLFIIL